EPGEGVLVYAGTGSVALHLAADGTSVRAGGHGYLIDDAGGGFWIGRETLKRQLRRADASGAPAGGALANAVFAELGGSSWQAVRAAVYGGGRARLAALTPLVAHAAHRGDPDAVAVLEAAGKELARLANVVSGRLGRLLPVALAGGVAACGEPLLAPLRAALPGAAELAVAAGKPVEAAARLASRLRDGSVSLPEPALFRPPG
ncbi:MAG TPA: BadF/BadG/BcrA/BcrD ATPase family protein, partial [Trueperaceae bacterium]|nr:BadF/BadG/BcrA/BcrD ATPase family protein [Trueperaceae bacterium]